METVAERSGVGWREGVIGQGPGSERGSSGGGGRSVDRGLVRFAAEGVRPALGRGGGPIEGPRAEGEACVRGLQGGAWAGEGGGGGGDVGRAAGLVAGRVALGPRSSGSRLLTQLYLLTAGPHAVLERQRPILEHRGLDDHAGA